MEVYDAIYKRRSVRQYDNTKTIDEVVLKRIMDAAIWAPSALNSQNWKFFLLQGEKRDQFAKLLTPIFERMKETLEKNYGAKDIEIRRKLYMDAGGAPVVIACYVEEGAWDYDFVGPSMACENILLAATSEGLSSLFIGSPRYVKESIDEFLGVKDMKLLGAILLGYPEVIPEPRDRRDGRVVWL